MSPRSTIARATLAQNDVLERLQKLGVNIAIDDFGMKYSSLDYLRTYHVNRIKIPQLLIDAASRDQDSAAMARAIRESRASSTLKSLPKG